MTKGGKSLFLLGLIAVLIAILTTGITLAIYHNSGDIYLDRSRPGFLPDEEEIEENDKEQEYTFSKTGKLSVKDLEEYLEKLDIDVKAVDAFEGPFDAKALSDEQLGIPAGEETQKE